MPDPTSRISAPPRSRSYETGDVIADKYRLAQRLGEGGMGTVWLARNLALDTDVAIKLIRAEVKAVDAAERLLKEARAAAQLEHPAIVRIYDFGQTPCGDPFIVMEMLEGESLAEVIDRRARISPVRAVQTLLPVIDALSVAHKRGIVHRDLKPDNIFLARSPHRTMPKLVDFGIVKFSAEEPSQTLTLNGTILGSPEYMSPEQARGQADVDHRADIWAISAVLYEAIAGRTAFRGGNYNALMRSIIEDAVTPTTDLAAGDATLWEILKRGLEKDRDARWQDIRGLGVALAIWLFERGVGTDLCGQSLTAAWLSSSDSDGVEEPDPFAAPAPRSDATRGSDHSLHDWAQPTVPGQRASVDSLPRGLATSVRPIARRRWPAVLVSSLALVGVGWLAWASGSTSAPSPAGPEHQSRAAADPKPHLLALNPAPAPSGSAPQRRDDVSEAPTARAMPSANSVVPAAKNADNQVHSRRRPQTPRTKPRPPKRARAPAKPQASAEEPTVRKLDLKDPY